MKLEYQLTESDFLEYQLYSSSRSESHNKKRQRNRIILAGLFIVFGVYHTLKDENYIGIIVFGIGALLLFLFYPFYSGWRYKNHFKNHIKETYQNRINIPVQVELNDGFIETKDSSSKSKIKGAEYIDELNWKWK